MFGTVLTLLYTLLLGYILWRARSVPPIRRRLSGRGFIIIGAVLWLVFFLGRVVGHDGSGAAAAVMEFCGMFLLGWVFLVTVVLLAVDLVTLFGLVLRRWVPAFRGAGILAGTGLAAIALVQGLRAPAVVSHRVALADLPAALDGTVLVAMSDAHLGAQLGAGWFEARVRQIQALQPDVLVFVGDMFEGHGGDLQHLPGLGRLEVPLGKWYVHGNHESHHHGGAGDGVLQRAGFRRLDNQWVEPVPGLILAGVEDLTSHRRRHRDTDPLGKALAGRPRGATVLLSHTPWQMERAASSGVDLMLSGHTHGGQIWPLGNLVQTVYPLLAGRQEIDGMTAIVTRGAGTWGPRMRLWHRGEILEITLGSRTP